jgi:3-keto-disaccharide hydrolase
MCQRTCLLVALSLVSIPAWLGARATDSAQRVSLFDGRTLAGWEGNPDVFRVKDGAIVGGTLDAPIPRNEFLCSQREYADFELRLKFKLRGEKPNAGVQIRSRRIPNHHEMIGYQADLGDGYWGALYDESRRRKILAHGDSAELAKVLRPADWNDYVIRCQGKRLQLWINGYQTVDYTEPDDSIEQRGLIGLQIHAGKPSEAWYKDISIQEL